MSKKRKHHDFPDRETLIEYLKGGLSYEERHRIEKLMLEHEFLREVVEGLESEDTEELEEDLEELSLSIRQRSGLIRDGGFNVYRLAATISLIILASVVIFIAIDWMNQSRQDNELSLNKQVPAEIIEGAEDNDETKSVGEGNNDEGSPRMPVDQSPERPVEKQADEKVKKTDEIPPSRQARETDPQSGVRETEEPIAAVPQVQEAEDVLALETADEERKEILYEREKSAARKSDLPEAVTSSVAGEKVMNDKIRDESYSGLSLPYMTAANLPYPVDGYESYMQYLTDSLRYPEPALKNGIEGQVVVVFYVGADSIPSGFSVINSLGYGCDQEAVRLIREGPAWLPAVTGGKVVESEMKLPIRFTLPGDQEK